MQDNPVRRCCRQHSCARRISCLTSRGYSTIRSRSDLVPEASREAILREEPKYRTPILSVRRAGVVLRSRFAEDRLAAAAARGVRQYIIAAAGLDTFPWRQPGFAREMRIFVTDLPESLAVLQDCVRRRGLPQPANLAYVPIDLEHKELLEPLVAAGFDPQLPTFCSALGIIQFLTLDAVDALLTFAARRAKGSEIVFSFTPPDDELDERERRGVRESQLRTQGYGEPWLTRLRPSQLTAHLTPAWVQRHRAADARPRKPPLFSRALRRAGEHVERAGDGSDGVTYFLGTSEQRSPPPRRSRPPSASLRRERLTLEPTKHCVAHACAHDRPVLARIGRWLRRSNWLTLAGSGLKLPFDALDRGFNKASPLRAAISHVELWYWAITLARRNCAASSRYLTATEQLPVLPEETKPSLLPMKLLPRLRRSPRGIEASVQVSDLAVLYSCGSNRWRAGRAQLQKDTRLLRCRGPSSRVTWRIRVLARYVPAIRALHHRIHFDLSAQKQQGPERPA